MCLEIEKLKKAISKINADLHHVPTWSIQNGLRLNISKYIVLYITPQNLLQTLNENGVAVMLERGSWQNPKAVNLSYHVYYQPLRRVDHISPFRDAVQLLPVETVCRLLTCCMVLKFREPHYLSKKLVSGGEGLSTKHLPRWKISLPESRFEVGRRGFYYFRPAICNGLPEYITSVVSCLSFKDKMKEFLINTN
ncbi:hypothetical protein J6590_008573 [Homalodisca vitripennis]|nr:hypothetical protein J6590_008573 [Homalodisca vitripennis]